MSTGLEHVIGTDSKWIFPLVTTDNEAYQAALALDPLADISDHQTPTDVTGAYFYFQVFAADGVTMIADKSNDPSGSNVGIVLRAPTTGGVVEVSVSNADMAGATVGQKLCYVAMLRTDPAGADLGRSQVAAGNIEITQSKTVIV